MGDFIEGLICRTIGCTGLFARWFEWPHKLVCTPISNRRNSAVGHRQKGKNKKRKKSWHRGKGEAKRWEKANKKLKGK